MVLVYVLLFLCIVEEHSDIAKSPSPELKTSNSKLSIVTTVLSFPLNTVTAIVLRYSVLLWQL